MVEGPESPYPAPNPPDGPHLAGVPCGRDPGQAAWATLSLQGLRQAPSPWSEPCGFDKRPVFTSAASQGRLRRPPLAVSTDEALPPSLGALTAQHRLRGAYPGLRPGVGLSPVQTSPPSQTPSNLGLCVGGSLPTPGRPLIRDLGGTQAGLEGSPGARPRPAHGSCVASGQLLSLSGPASSSVGGLPGSARGLLVM